MREGGGDHKTSTWQSINRDGIWLNTRCSEGLRKDGHIIMHLKQVFDANASTDLDPVIAGMPWLEGFEVGAGVNAVTGGLAARAVQFGTVKKAGKTHSETNFRSVEDASQLTQEIEVAVKGKYNIEGVTISASAEYINKIKFSETSMTLLAFYESGYDYDEADSYTLTPDAQARLANLDDFRATFGDYFVSGGKRMSRFVGIYVCQARTAEQLQSFKLSLGADASELFSAEGSAKLSQVATQTHTEIFCDISMWPPPSGAPPVVKGAKGYSPDQILQLLEWFQKDEQGVYMNSKLTHYSVIAPSIPHSLSGVAPSVFAALRVLYTTLWEIRGRYNTCPKAYQNQLSNDFLDLDSTITASQSQLPQDQDMRMQFQQKAGQLLSRLNVIFERMDFFYAVHALVGTEPGQGQEIDEGTGQQSWLYGFNKYTKSPAVVIHQTEKTFNEWVNGPVGHQVRTLEFQDQACLIVGWEAASNWTDGYNGWWYKDTGQILLTNRAAVHFSSLYDHNCNWTMRVYYVDANDYQFDTPTVLAGEETPNFEQEIIAIEIQDWINNNWRTMAMASEGMLLSNGPAHTQVNAIDPYGPTTPPTRPPPLQPRHSYKIKGTIKAKGSPMPAQPGMSFDHIMPSNPPIYVFYEAGLQSSEEEEEEEEERTLIMPKGAQLMDLKPRLQLASGDTILITAEQVMVGRGLSETPEAAAIDLSAEQEKATVSRIHAQITRVDDHFEIEDRNSSNQTRLNQEILVSRRRYRLSHGDVIEFGKVRCIFNLA